MRFVSEDRYLLSCGKRSGSTVVISDMYNYGVHISTYLDIFVRNIVTLTCTLGELHHIRKQRERHECTFYFLCRDRFIKNNCREFNYKMKPAMIAEKMEVSLGATNAALFLIYNDKKATMSTIASRDL